MSLEQRCTRIRYGALATPEFNRQCGESNEIGVQGSAWMDQHVQLLEDVAKPERRVGSMAGALRLVEGALLQAAALAPSWPRRRRAPWLASLAAADAGDTRSMLLHTAALQAGSRSEPERPPPAALSPGKKQAAAPHTIAPPAAATAPVCRHLFARSVC